MSRKKILTGNTFFLTVISIIALALLLRIPLTSHSVGADSFFIQSLAVSITASNSIGWAIHPLSLVGLPPLSYPTGNPVLLAIESMIFCESVEFSVLINGFVYTIIGMVGCYAIGIKFFNNKFYACLCSLFFAITPYFIQFTRWEGSSRGPLLALAPLIYILIFNLILKRNLKIIILLGIFFCTLITIHKTAFLLALPIMAYLIFVTGKYLLRLFVKNNSGNIQFVCSWFIQRKIVIFVSAVVFLIGIQFLGIRFFSNMWYQHIDSSFLIGNSPIILLLNLSINYFGKIGIPIICIFIGIISLLLNKKGPISSYILICLLFALLFLGKTYYIIIIFLPLLIILEVEGIRFSYNQLSRKFNENTILLVIIFLIITSVIFSCSMVDRKLSADSFTNIVFDEEYQSSIYLKTIGLTVIDDRTLGTPISAFTNIISTSPKISFISETGGSDYGYLIGFNKGYVKIPSNYLELENYNINSISLDAIKHPFKIFNIELDYPETKYILADSNREDSWNKDVIYFNRRNLVIAK